ncbi:MAG: hypothetical protein E7474_06580 [Ruminococcaceae bacterium]|nr:hypothetical protein [Oscillospiraceae bacterium]
MENPEERIKYWVYEIEMAEALHIELERQLALFKMTPDEYFAAAIRNMLDDPDGTKRMIEAMKACPEDRQEIRLIRYYPVLTDETEAQAKCRKLAEESEESAI